MNPLVQCTKYLVSQIMLPSIYDHPFRWQTVNFISITRYAFDSAIDSGAIYRLIGPFARLGTQTTEEAWTWYQK